MTFLIDGYNLMHAVGLARRGLRAREFQQARVRFLDWLADAVGDRPDVLRVVFDAQNGPFPSNEYGYRGVQVRVRFAFRQTADEQIEELVHADPLPRRLTVVTNDAQVRDAGRRARCATLTCQEFVDWLIAGVSPPDTSPAADDKPAPDPTPAEMSAWLAAFSTPPQKRR